MRPGRYLERAVVLRPEDAAAEHAARAVPGRSRPAARVPMIRPLVPLAVAILAAAAFLPTLSGSFLNWDDNVNFLENPRIGGSTASMSAGPSRACSSATTSR